MLLAPIPEPKSKKEPEILELLRKEYKKADAVARAGAIFEAEVHEQLLHENLLQGMDEDEAGDVPKVFSVEDLNDSFVRLLRFRIELRMLDLLQLGEHKEALAEKLIERIFSARRSGRKSIFVGSPESREIHELKNS